MRAATEVARPPTRTAVEIASRVLELAQVTVEAPPEEVS
jgi:hypothetical protein